MGGFSTNSRFNIGKRNYYFPLSFLGKHQFSMIPEILKGSISQPFFWFRQPYLVLKKFGGTPGYFNKCKCQRIARIGDTPGTSTRQPGWELLF